MNHIEGDYEEIVKWMDGHPTRGIGFATLHGHTLEGYFNVGLFSINGDHELSEEECYTCQHGSPSGKGMVVEFAATQIPFDGEEFLEDFKVEHPEESHLIRF